jgi:hypothetical protein
MRRKNKKLVNDLLDAEFDLIVALLRGFSELDEVIEADKVDEIFIGLNTCVKNLNEANLKVRKVLRHYE